MTWKRFWHEMGDEFKRLEPASISATKSGAGEWELHGGTDAQRAQLTALMAIAGRAQYGMEQGEPAPNGHEAELRRYQQQYRHVRMADRQGT